MRRSGWIRWALALLALAILPLAADRLRSREERCALDGATVAPAFRVRAVDAGGADRVFCGIQCAQLWAARQDRPLRALVVTDAATGREVDAATAWYVRALSTRADGAPDAIRAFAAHAEAERFVAAYGGEILVAKKRPFTTVRSSGGERDTQQ